MVVDAHNHLHQRLVFHCRTTSASTAPCTSRRMCCHPGGCAALRIVLVIVHCALRAFSGWIRSPHPTVCITLQSSGRGALGAGIRVSGTQHCNHNFEPREKAASVCCLPRDKRDECSHVTAYEPVDCLRANKKTQLTVLIFRAPLVKKRPCAGGSCRGTGTPRGTRCGSAAG